MQQQPSSPVEALSPIPQKRSRSKLSSSFKRLGRSRNASSSKFSRASKTKKEVIVSEAIVIDDFTFGSTSLFLYQNAPPQPQYQHRPFLEPPNLPLELIGHISTFLTVAEVGDIIVAAAAISRDAVGIIRFAYLHRNYSYLAHSWIEPYRKRLHNITEWMKVNSDWRKLYYNASAVKSGVFNLIFRNLMRATEVGHIDIVRHLIEQRGADVNREEPDVKSRAGIRPILIAFQLPDPTILQYYLNDVEGLELNYFITPRRCGIRFLHHVVSLRAYGNGTESLRLLLKREDIDVDARLDNGMTPLHLLVARKTMPLDVAERIRCLIEAGASWTSRDELNETPLDTFKKRQTLSRTIRREIKHLLKTGDIRQENCR